MQSTFLTTRSTNHWTNDKLCWKILCALEHIIPSTSDTSALRAICVVVLWSFRENRGSPHFHPHPQPQLFNGSENQFGQLNRRFAETLYLRLGSPAKEHRCAFEHSSRIF